MTTKLTLLDNTELYEKYQCNYEDLSLKIKSLINKIDNTEGEVLDNIKVFTKENNEHGLKLMKQYIDHIEKIKYHFKRDSKDTLNKLNEEMENIKR